MKNISSFLVFFLILITLIGSSCNVNNQGNETSVFPTATNRLQKENVHSPTPNNRVVVQTTTAAETPSPKETTRTPTKNQSSPTITETVVSNNPDYFNNMVVFIQDYLNTSTYFYFKPETTDKNVSNKFEQVVLGYPGPSSPGSGSLSFANFKDQIAYVDKELKVWKSDLMHRKPVEIYDYPEGDDNVLYLTWTPNDLHILLDASDSGLPNMIYHVKSGQIEPWEFKCEDLALSPHSKELAIWCRSTNNPNHFAILEWNGDIWYRDNPPASVLLTAEGSSYNDIPRFRLLSLYTNAGWSSDGMKIAFFDPKDKSGHIKIVDRFGKELGQNINQVSKLDEVGVSNSLLGNPIQWSNDNNRLLILAGPSQKKPCPKIGPEFHVRDQETPQNCWQVVDLSKKEIIWSSGELINDEMIEGSHKDGEAVISQDGRFIALFTYIRGPDPRCYVIELDTGRVFVTPFTVERMRWGVKD